MNTDSAWYDEFQQTISDKITEHGHMIMGVGGDGSSPSFAYTIGVSPRFGFEFIILGVPYQYAAVILNDVVAHFNPNTGRSIEFCTQNYDEFANTPVRFYKCDSASHEYTIQANLYFSKKVEAVQIVYPDRQNRFPDHPQYDRVHMMRIQRLLYTPTKLH